jgi:transcription elongation factor GreA
MPEDTVTLMDAARSYLASLANEQRIANQAEVERFVRWLGADRAIDLVRGQEVANYADTLTGTVTDATGRADIVRAFLAFAKKAGFSQTNLGSHIRLRKGVASSKLASRPVLEVEMTIEQKTAFEAELVTLKAQRPRIVADLKRAMEDKDFRENAPLDAAKQEQGLVEGRIRELEHQLAHAVIVEQLRSAGSEEVDIGATVVLRNLKTNAETTYTLVRPGEVNAAAGKISYKSPVGEALLTRRAGDEVEVAAPSGTLHFRIERVQA